MHDQIKERLTSQHINYKEIRHDSFATPIRSPFDFAKALDYEPERITKSVFLRSKIKDKYIMAVCSCGKKLNLPKLALLAGVNKLEVADQQELTDLVGYPVHGVSSIGLSSDIEAFMDKALLDFTTVLAGSGETAVEIELSPKNLAELSNATLDDISL
ncbi:aminoacyl-tRNA deacylase [Pedobacter sp. L105]|uniref:aminoacyl-tRNA deacylase n=1 Tax=Pedobacter sp. L105 TaxID=1641871 RepID=UPI00131A643D|nr:YbaK/EbsC family protein [Pedobacter sp. L105]